MSVEATDADKLVYIIDTRDASAYHPRSDCSHYQGASGPRSRVPLSTIPDRTICDWCENPLEASNWKNGQCRHCGEFMHGGECRFCDAFDRLHAVPADAKFCPVDQRGVVVE